MIKQDEEQNHFYLLFTYFLATLIMQKFPGQGSNPHHSSNQSHSSYNAGPLTHWATRELQRNKSFFKRLIQEFPLERRVLMIQLVSVEVPVLSIDRGMDKEDIHNGILLSHKKEWNNASCSNMDVLRDYHIKWIKSEREGQISFDITHMWNQKYSTNQHIYETKIDSQL